MRGMKTPTAPGSIRLPLDHWVKLRALMRHHQGRAWLEKVIDREHKKIEQAVGG